MRDIPHIANILTKKGASPFDISNYPVRVLLCRSIILIISFYSNNLQIINNTSNLLYFSQNINLFLK